MKKLLVYLRPYRLQAILAPVFKLLEAAFELLVPLIMADIIDVGIAAGDTGYILKKCLLLVGLGLCGFASATCAQYFSAKAATGATASLRHALFAHIQSLSYAELDTIGPATLVTRMTSDMNQVQTGLNLTLRLLLRSPIVVFGSMIMAFTIDVRSALIFVVTIPVLFAIVFAIMLSCIPLYRRVQAKLDGVTGAAQENLSGVRVIRAFTREQTETESFDGRLDGLFAAQRFVGKLSALLNPLTYVVINLAIVAILKTGSVRVDAGVITQGQLIALYNYMSQILVELIKFANLILNITKSVACAGRISQVLETKSSMADGQDALPDNLRWGNAQASDEDLWQALQDAQADQVVRGKQGGLDAEVEPGGRNFSGGQRQRLTIARALVRRPAILILDDSASALDFATDAALRKALAHLPWKPTVVLISQRVSSIRHADQILVLDDGRLAGTGTHDELLQSCPVYQEICRSQYKKEDAQ